MSKFAVFGLLYSAFAQDCTNAEEEEMSMIQTLAQPTRCCRASTAECMKCNDPSLNDCCSTTATETGDRKCFQNSWFKFDTSPPIYTSDWNKVGKLYRWTSPERCEVTESVLDPWFDQLWVDACCPGDLNRRPDVRCNEKDFTQISSVSFTLDREEVGKTYRRFGSVCSSSDVKLGKYKFQGSSTSNGKCKETVRTATTDTVGDCAAECAQATQPVCSHFDWTETENGGQCRLCEGSDSLSSRREFYDINDFALGPV